MRLDCDADTVLLRVESVAGIACHTGRRRCFFNRLEGEGGDRALGRDRPRARRARDVPPMAERDILERLERAIAARRGADPAASYVAALNARGLDAILKKIGEEATETVLAAKSGEQRGDRARDRRPLVPLPGDARAPISNCWSTTTCAACPDATASAAVPPSSAATRSSSTALVGFPIRV